MNFDKKIKFRMLEPINIGFMFNPIHYQQNKTGLQPVSRPVELVHYFGGWVEGPSKVN